MQEKLIQNICEYLRLEHMLAREGRTLIKRISNSARGIFRREADIADFYLANEAEIKSLLEEHGKPFEDIETAVEFTFERVCEEMEEEAGWLDEFYEASGCEDREDFYQQEYARRCDACLREEHDDGIIQLDGIEDD